MHAAIPRSATTPATTPATPARTPAALALSVVVPVYDEADVLDVTIARLADHLAELEPAFELIAVDDGSRDTSGALLEKWRERVPQLRVVTHARNRGKGAALRSGALAARGARVVVMDADLSAHLTCTRELLAALDAGADVVFGSRRAPGAVLGARQPRLRESLGCAFTRLARIASGVPLTDFTCGLKAFRRPVASELFDALGVNRWAFDAELAALASVRSYRLVEVPVRWAHQPGSKVRVLRAAAGALLDLARIARRRVLGLYERP